MVEVSGRTREEAVAKAIAKLGIREADANVTVLAERKAKFFGLLGAPEVKVRVSKRARGAEPSDASDVDRVREVVEGILKTMQISARVHAEGGGGQRRVVVETADSDGLLIGRHGQTLAALEHIANRILTRGRDNRPTVSIDIAGYKGRQHSEGDDAPRPQRERVSGARSRPGRRARAGAR